MTSITLPEFDRSLPMMLLRAREAAMSRFRPILSDAGVTEQQWRVVRTLADVDEATPSELGERCVLLPPSMTRIAKTLAGRGLIERRSDDFDQRRTLLSITPRGRALVNELSPRIAAVYSDLNERLGEPGLAALLGELDALIDGAAFDERRSA